jgi:hypothetical protein
LEREKQIVPLDEISEKQSYSLFSGKKNATVKLFKIIDLELIQLNQLLNWKWLIDQLLKLR